MRILLPTIWAFAPRRLGSEFVCHPVLISVMSAGSILRGPAARQFVSALYFFGNFVLITFVSILGVGLCVYLRCRVGIGLE